MHRLVFLDLDDTLFQSHRKCPNDGELHPTAYLADGRAHSFMTARQRSLWQLLDDQSTLIPTTARDHDALRRVDLPFQSWCIIDYGGVILNPDGEPDSDWMARMEAYSHDSLDELNDLLDRMLTFVAREGLTIRARLIEDFGVPFYLVAKYRDARESDLDRLQDALAVPWLAERAGAYRLHRNGNNLAIIPRWLGKERAVRHLITRLGREWGELLTIGIGDSLIDGAFMAECDYAITPRGSQLFEATLSRVLI
ncbi:haloacid dehalogenase [Allochromatium palmeri]|uniref:Haloacid dehalogenase n=1 Tax=Allochromatium palmeri TaxID=231048 RepID=A0A6N8EJK4_9GAMM|nr:haloacid dehalogenase [Allochromatium palmeri]